jgi:IS5 family transposase
MKGKCYGKREKFLDSMKGIIPWLDFIEVIEPFYPKSGRPGWDRTRIYFLQARLNLADEAPEESVYDSFAIQDCFMEEVPDAPPLLKFRHLPEGMGCKKNFSTRCIRF